MPAGYQTALKRLTLDSYGLRVVVSVYGLAADTPRTPDARRAYCSYVADLLRDNAEIDDVAIWNDPNDGTSGRRSSRPAVQASRPPSTRRSSPSATTRHTRFARTRT